MRTELINTNKIIISLILFLLFSSCIENTQKKADRKGEIKKSDSTVTVKKKKVVIIDKKQVKKPTDPLPSWNNTKTKKALTAFVEKTSLKNSSSYVIPENRIATFDGDGTLWAEQPTYFQIEFVLDRIKQLAPDNPDWGKNKLIQIAIKHDLETLRKKYGVKGIAKLMTIAQSEMTTDEFEAAVHNWIKIAKHPVTGKLFSKMVYLPMLEFVKYLQHNNFKVYIVSNGEIDFIRAWAEEVYGIPRENVIGSVAMLKYEKTDGKPVLKKTQDLLFINDAENKPMAIHQIIGKKPTISFGNSDGDLQMLEWCSANNSLSLPVFIHHTDSIREWAYDRESRIGRLDLGLTEAGKNSWLVIDMKRDWKNIYPL